MIKEADSPRKSSPRIVTEKHHNHNGCLAGEPRPKRNKDNIILHFNITYTKMFKLCNFTDKSDIKAKLKLTETITLDRLCVQKKNHIENCIFLKKISPKSRFEKSGVTCVTLLLNVQSFKQSLS